MIPKMIEAALRANQIPFDPELPEKLSVYLELLMDWNTRMDLTAVLEEDEMLDKHFMDSLFILKTDLLNQVQTLIDVGTGAGFPGLVIAMACPQINVTLMDAQQKRLRFLDAVCEETGLSNVAMIHGRAEDGGQNRLLREKFDLSTARAVAPLNILCEYLIPFVKVGGKAICWKGPALWNELEQGEKAAAVLGGDVEEPISYTVAGREWEHNLLPIRKQRKTDPGYPRGPGLIKARPLCGKFKVDPLTSKMEGSDAQ